MTVFELLQYGLLLQSAHYRAACLLTTDSARCDVPSVQNQVLCALSQEWQLVLKLERTQATQTLIANHCPFVSWQPYRETMSMCELHNFTLCPELRLFLASYHPPMQSSSNIEDIFAELQDAVRRSNKSSSGSLPNMCAVAIRAVHKKIESSSENVKGSELRAEDWEGNAVRALKTSIFQPQSCPSSYYTCLEFLLQHSYVLPPSIFIRERPRIKIMSFVYITQKLQTVLPAHFFMQTQI